MDENKLQSVLVFGVTGTIGNAVAQHCDELGMTVYGISRRPPENGVGKNFCVDILDSDTLTKVVQELPSLNLVVFAQGIRPELSLRDMTREHATAMLETNVTGVLLALRQLLPHLASGACIVLIASSAATKGSYDPAYAAAKGALISLTRSLAKELKDQVRVNCIAPGLVANSPVHRSMTREHSAKHEARMFQGLLVKDEDVARLILDIFANRSLNGSVIPIDGGYAD